MRRQIALALALLSASACLRAGGAVKTWVAPGGGLYSNGKNWKGGKAPVSGDSLVFPLDKKAIRNYPLVNDIDGLSVHDVTMSGTWWQQHAGKPISISGVLRLEGAGGCKVSNQLRFTGVPADGGALIAKSGGDPAALLGKVVVEGSGRGDAVISASGHLAFAGGVETRRCGIALSMAAEAQKAGRTIAFSGPTNLIDGRLFAEGVNLLLLSPVRAKGGVETKGGKLDARIMAASAGGVFLAGERPIFVRTCSQAAPDGMAYKVSDWSGRQISGGTWPKGDRLALPASEKGYYWIKLENGVEASFAVVARPEERRSGPESWYGACGVTSVERFSEHFDCPWYGPATDLFAIDVAARAGVRWTRSWLWMGDAVQKDGSLRCADVLSSAREARKRGISTCLCAQTHSKRSKGGTDLAEVYRNMKLAGEKLGGDIKTWEYLNECDSNGAPGWQVAAALKAASLGLRAACPDAVLSPPSEHAIFLKAYDETLYGSEIGKYVDCMNYHFYSTIAQTHKKVAGYRQRAALAGMAPRECWATEAGTYIEGGGRARAHGRFDCFMAHDRAQELCTAEFIPKLFANSRMLGVRRTFAFTFRPFNQQGGRKDWCWALRRDGAVRPAYAAFSAMAERLDGAELEGEVGVSHKDVAAFAYRQKDGTFTLTFWTKTEMDTSGFGQNIFGGPDPAPRKFALRVPAGSYRLFDMCGAPAGVAAADKKGLLNLVSTRYPKYVEGIPRLYNRYVEGEANLLPAVEPGRPRRDAVAQDEDLTVVIRPTYSPADFSFKKGSGDRAVLGKGKESGRVSFVCWNLSGKPKKGALRVLSGKASGIAGKALELPPMGSATVEGMVRREDFSDGEMLLSVDGMFSGRRATTAAIALAAEKEGR